MPRRWGHDRGPLGRPPARGRRRPLDALIATIRTQGGLADTPAAGVGRLTPGQDGRRQGLILGPGRSAADPRDHPPRPDGPAPVEALVPAEAVAPAAIGPARQPAGPTTLGLPRRHRRAVQGFVGPLATRQAVPQGQEARHDGRVVTAPQALQRAPRGPRGKGRAPGLGGVAVERPFASQTGPRPKEAQGDHLTPAERGPRTWVKRWRPRGWAALVNHHGPRGQEGIRGDPGTTPLKNRHWSWTLVAGCRPLKAQLVDSHQALQEEFLESVDSSAISRVRGFVDPPFEL